MATKLFLNLGSKSPRSSLVMSREITTPVPAPDFALGDKVPLEITLLDGEGGIVTPATYNMRLALGTPGDVPTSGTYTVTIGANTSAAIAYNASAAALQSALEAMASVGAGNVLVSGSFPIYSITFIGTKANTNISAPTFTATNLFPESSPYVIATVNGGGGANETWLMRVYRTPLALQSSWSTTSETYSATLDCATNTLAQELGEAAEISSFLEVELTNTSTGDVVTALQIPCTIRADVTNASTTTPVALDTHYTTDQTDSAFVANYSGITEYAGTGASSLGIVATVGVTPGLMAVVNHSTGAYVYRLISSTAAANHPMIVRPNDYAATTNEKVWELQRLGCSGVFATDPLTVTSFAGEVEVDHLVLDQISAPATEDSLWNDSGNRVLRTNTLGLASSLVGCIFSQSAAGTAVTNTTSETSLVGTGYGTRTLPAYWWRSAKTVRMRMSGELAQASGTGNVTIALKIGSATTSITVATETFSACGFVLEAVITCRTTGASGTYGVDLRLTVGGSASAMQAVKAASTRVNATLNTTASGQLDFTVTHSSASASNSWQSHTCTVEVLN